MPSSRALLHGSLLIISTSLSHALPIKEDAIISRPLPRNSFNLSSLGSTYKDTSDAHFVSEGGLPIITEDSENPSLLTSIPTFAPPVARKERRDERNDVGISVPIPTISFGIPSLRETRRYISEGFRRLLRRSPEAQNATPLPPATTDATQPHKAPVSDATVNFMNEERLKNDSESADPLNDGAGVAQTKEDNPPNDANSQTSEELASNAGNIIQDMASPGTASETPTRQGEAEVATTSSVPNPHSLSSSLGTISHAQWEEEDKGRKRSKRDPSNSDEAVEKREPHPDDIEALGQVTEDDDVPTIWNGKVDLDDLNWFELQELDDWLDNLAWAHAQNKKASFRNSSSAARPTANPDTSLAPASSSSTSNDSSTSPSLKSAKVAAPPKSLAKALGLRPHSASQNRTHLGDRRDKIIRSKVDDGFARKLLEIRSKKLLDPVSAQNGDSKSKREDAYDPNLEPIDISDEAFDEFRKEHPTFFGDGWREKEKRTTIEKRDKSRVGKRDPRSPNWFAMLLSPSALLEKRPVGRTRGFD